MTKATNKGVRPPFCPSPSPSPSPSPFRALVCSSVALAPGEVTPKGSRRGELRRMCERLWGPVLLSLTHVMAHCSDPLVVAAVVDGYKSFAVVSGVLGEDLSHKKTRDISTITAQQAAVKILQLKLSP